MYASATCYHALQVSLILPEPKPKPRPKPTTFVRICVYGLIAHYQASTCQFRQLPKSRIIAGPWSWVQIGREGNLQTAGLHQRDGVTVVVIT